MKKSKAIKELHKFLQQYDACKFRKKEAEEILDFLVLNELLLPPGAEDSFKGRYPRDWSSDRILKNEWRK